jgi:dimeric dUTPase (all-alpha-NTP-PPase superfamily)
VNLPQLFQMQRELDDRIIKKHELHDVDLFPNTILASLVELAECANEWRGFKHWSKDQEPKTKAKCIMCDGLGNDIYYSGSLRDGSLQECSEPCEFCDGMGNDDSKNPLLEEYVDKLHFILSLGNQKGFDQELTEFAVEKRENIQEQFIHLFYLTSTFIWFDGLAQYQLILGYFVGLGEMLGFTWEQVEQAYFEKNAVNHERQESGY